VGYFSPHVLAIAEQKLGTDHSNTATSLDNLATLHWKQKKYAEAKPLFQRSIAIYEQQLGTSHPYTINTRRRFDMLLKEMQYRR
jgi:Tetratricopeptide repeat